MSDTSTTPSELDLILLSIRDLDAEWDNGEISDADYRKLRDSYTARAAAMAEAAAARPPEVKATRTPSRSRDGRRVVVAIAVVAFAVLAGVAVSSSAGDRTAGEQATGSITEGNSDRILRAQQLVSDGEILEAVKVYDSVLEDDPDHPVALAQRGWLISRAGLLDDGLGYVDKAIAVDETYVEARFFRAMILRDKGDVAAATTEFNRILELNPPTELRQVVEQALASLQ